MARATQLDPHFAAALVRRVLLAGEAMEEQRALVSAAVQSRGLLDARDARFLELAQLVVGDATANEARKDNARALAKEMPDDPEAQFWAAQVLEGANESDEARRMAGRVLELDPKFAAAEHMRARIARNLGDLDGELTAAQRCLVISPSAASCARRVADVHAARGECVALEAAAHRIIALEPNGDLGYGFLMTALAAQGTPADALEQLAKKSEAVTTDARDARRLALAHADFIAVYQGDFATAESSLVALDKEFGDAVDEGEHPWPVVLAMLYEEEGQDEKALTVAEDYLRRRRAWLHDHPTFARDYALVLQHDHHRIGDAEFRSTRAAWLAEDQKFSTREEWLWSAHYGVTARNPDEAKEALAALTTSKLKTPGKPGLFFADDAIHGHVHLLAGDARAALPWLESATTACGHTPEHALDLGAAMKALIQIQSFLWLARALEETGDKAGSCAAYQHVLDRWGNAKPRSTSADEARKHVKGCSVEGHL
jgi:serine/threonine-protein kinase